MKKILIAVPDTNVGGITTSAVNFSNELTSCGHKVFFLDMSGENACADRLNEKVTLLALSGKSRLWNINAKNLKNIRGFKKLGVLAFGAVKKLTIRSGLWYKIVFSEFNKGESYDVAVAFRQCDPCYSFVLNKVNAKKKIGFIHGELAYMDYISSWKRHMDRFDKIAYVSNAVKEQFVKTYPELERNACTIYNTFDVEQIKAMAEDECDVKFDKNKVNIVTVARIDNGFKQIDWIVKICDSLRKKTHTPFHWYVVGGGPDYDSTVAMAAELGLNDILTFVGNQPNPYSFIKQSDFTVLTSKSEAYPMVVIESFVLKKPIVVTRFASVTEMMEAGNHGFIAEQSIDNLVELVGGMIDNTDGIREKCAQYLQGIEINNDIPYAQFLDAIGD